jgi:hypothetical protein
MFDIHECKVGDSFPIKANTRNDKLRLDKKSKPSAVKTKANNNKRRRHKESKPIVSGYRRAALFIGGLAIVSIAIAAIAIPNLLKARVGSNPVVSAVGSLRTLNVCQAFYIERSPSQRYGALKDLQQDGYIDNVLGSSTKNLYRFDITVPKAMEQYKYAINASPVALEKPDSDSFIDRYFYPSFYRSNNRYFFTNQSGVIRFEDNKPANSSSPQIGGGCRHFPKQETAKSVISEASPPMT